SGERGGNASERQRLVAARDAGPDEFIAAIRALPAEHAGMLTPAQKNLPELVEFLRAIGLGKDIDLLRINPGGAAGRRNTVLHRIKEGIEATIKEEEAAKAKAAQAASAAAASKSAAALSLDEAEEGDDGGEAASG